jgi:drug/metabolite transporter, DME family
MVISKQGLGTGVGFVLLANLGWSLSGIFVRLLPQLNFWQINAWRGYWAAIALLVYLLVAYRSQALQKFRDLPTLAMVMSALFFSVGTTFYILSLTKVSTATVSVIGATSPLFTGLLSPWITGERPKLVTWIAAFLALLGMITIVYGGLERGALMWQLFCLGVPFTFAMQTLLLRRYRHYDVMPAICVGGILMFISCGAFSIMNDVSFNAFTLDWRSMALLMLMGPVQLALPLIFYGMGAKTVPAITLSLLAMMDAIINPFWSWLFAGEVPEKLAIVGGSIILAAVAIAVIGESFSAKNSTAK